MGVHNLIESMHVVTRHSCVVWTIKRHSCVVWTIKSFLREG